VATKQVAQALRLIGRWRKDRRAHRAVFGFTDEYTHPQETETVKDLNTHQRAQLLDEREVVEHQGKGFQVVPFRWVVERTFAWLLNYRRHRCDYECHPMSRPRHSENHPPCGEARYHHASTASRCRYGHEGIQGCMTTPQSGLLELHGAEAPGPFQLKIEPGGG
jgi:transposase